MTKQSPTATLPQLLTQSDLAEYLQVSTNTLQNWRTMGGGPPFIKFTSSPAGSVRYRRDDVDRWLLSRHTVQPATTPAEAVHTDC